MQEVLTTGFSSPAESHTGPGLDLNQHLIKNPTATFFLQAASNAMTGAGIYPNDILIIDRSLPPRHRAIVAAVVQGQLIVRRLNYNRNQTWLFPENPDYTPLLLNPDLEFEFWGTVTHTIHCHLIPRAKTQISKKT